jgi:hypothetical protein
MKNHKRKVFLAVPDWETTYRAGGNSFRVTIFEWDYANRGLSYEEGEILVPAKCRSERKALRSLLLNAYGFPYARTVVIE